MRKLAGLMAMMVVAGLAAPLAAQSLRLSATIPFEFFVGSDRMPAGEYALESGGLPGALYVTRSDQRAYTFALGRPAEEQAAAGDVRLIFHRYGNDYFLREVRDGARSAVNRLQASIEERKLARGRSASGFERVAIQAAPM